MISISSYALKNRFQQCLAPARNKLVELGISPNQVTLTTCLLCLIYAFFMTIPTTSRLLLLLMPLFLLLRMALNALDGMVATVTHQKTPWGSVLNEMCDVISDVALLTAFFVLLPEHSFLLMALLFFSLLIEFTSLAVYQAVNTRSFSGPFSKSDRAIFMGCLALEVLVLPSTSPFIEGFIWLGLLLSGITIWNRLIPLNKYS